MPQVAVVADSTTSLPQEAYERHQMVMVPYYVHLQGRALRDTVDISTQELCDHLSSLDLDAELPTTACPGPGDYVDAFSRAAERAKEIVSLHMTSIGSGAYQAALAGRDLALQRLRGVRIEVIDTRNVSMCHGWLALSAARAADEGASLDDILALLRRLGSLTRMLQTADTLRYLYMGGRIGRAKHLIGSLLRIRPVVSMEDGVIVTRGVARSREGAYRRMATMLQRVISAGDRVRLALTHAAAEDGARHLLSLLEGVVRPAEVLFCSLSSALIVHSGPGTVGVCYLLDRP